MLCSTSRSQRTQTDWLRCGNHTRALGTWPSISPTLQRGSASVSIELFGGPHHITSSMFKGCSLAFCSSLLGWLVLRRGVQGSIPKLVADCIHDNRLISPRPTKNLAKRNSITGNQSVGLGLRVAFPLCGLDRGQHLATLAGEKFSLFVDNESPHLIAGRRCRRPGFDSNINEKSMLQRAPRGVGTRANGKCENLGKRFEAKVGNRREANGNQKLNQTAHPMKKIQRRFALALAIGAKRFPKTRQPHLQQQSQSNPTLNHKCLKRG